MGFDERTPPLSRANIEPVSPLAGCDDWNHAVPLYVDAELGEADRGAFETHLEGCDRCRHAAHFGRALRTNLRSQPVVTPSNLRNRVRHALKEESLPARNPLQLLRRLWSPMPVAAAGATALGITAWLWMGTPTDDVVRELVARHVRHLPLEFQSSDPASIQAWLDDKVDFHVNIPRPIGRPLSLMGARLWNVRNHAAVYLVYSTQQSPAHRVSMLVYDDPSGRLPALGTPERIDDHEVYRANRAGYNVAVWKQNEVVYSLVTDRPDDVTAMVHAADQN